MMECHSAMKKSGALTSYDRDKPWKHFIKQMKAGTKANICMIPLI